MNLRSTTAVAVLCLLALTACHKPTKQLTPQQAQVQRNLEKDRGLPIPLTLPPDAATPQDVDLIPPQRSTGMLNWNAPFAYAGGFEKVVASFDEQLKKQKFARLGGPLHDVDPGFKMGDNIKPVTASARKAWISDDRKIVVFLSYEYRRGDKGGAEVNNYQLNVLKADNPQEVKPPNKVKPIP